MKIPSPIAGLLVTAIAGGVAVAGELAMSHPLHQTIVIAAAFVTGLVGYFTLAPGSIAVALTGPPYDVGTALPPAPPAVPAPVLTPAQVDQLAATKAAPVAPDAQSLP